jgi:Domain of unknown function (DUF1906)
MGPSGMRDSARLRRRYFALAAVGALGSTLALGVTVGPHSSTAPRALNTPTRTTAAHPPKSTTTGSPAPAGPAAKASAEAAMAGNPSSEAPPPQTMISGAAQTPVTRTVQYDGYQVQVPGSWPVYDLATDSSQCVLFNAHAVYLGTPGSTQDCPAEAFGHTESLLIQPASPVSVPASAVVLPGETAALPQRTALPAAAASAAGASHLIQVDVPGPGVLVTAAYGADETQIRAILATATLTGTPASTPTGSGAPSSPATTAALRTAPATQGLMATGSEEVTGQAAAATQASTSTVSTSTVSTSAAAPKLSGMIGSGLGFDTCTAPSAAAMRAWLASPYRVAATYLGGMNWACSYGNFTASWVRTVAAEGWRFMPLWVGQQAPCTTVPYVATINPSQATAEGEAQARSAVAAARAFGYGQGTPIYFDMEAYNTSDSACSRAVLNFLGGWTRTLHADGYASGVYSSARSGIRDLAGQYGNSGYPRPDDIWIADWNSEPVLTDSAVPNADWANHQRLHQYAGPHGETWGGGTLDIDSDAADGLVAGLATAPVLRGPDESATPSELRVAPGQTSKVTLTLRGVAGTAASVRWQVTAPAGLVAAPDNGTANLSAGAVLSIPLTVTPSKALAARRYDLPITVTAGSGSQPVAKTFVLVSVVPAGRTLPTAHPLVLYAADRGDMNTAVAIARALALPSGDVIGSFSRAWADAAGGKDLVLAVGRQAANALYFNVCGWANPARMRAGSTPFYYPGEPQQQSPGRNYFELSDMSTAVGTAQLTTQLTQYALAGTLPDYGSGPAVPTPPTLTCLGSPNVSVP